MVLKDQTWPRFSLTLREFIETIICLRHGSKGPSMAKVLFNSERYVGVLIYPRHGSNRPGAVEVLFNP